MKRYIPLLILLMMMTSCAHIKSPFQKEKDLSLKGRPLYIKKDPEIEDKSKFGSINFDHWELKINIFNLFKNVAPDFSITQDFDLTPDETLTPCVSGVLYF